jgi:hypothetical protein
VLLFQDVSLKGCLLDAQLLHALQQTKWLRAGQQLGGLVYNTGVRLPNSNG